MNAWAALARRCFVPVCLVGTAFRFDAALGVDDPETVSLSLQAAGWTAEALSQRAEGAIAWIADNDGSLRIEFLISEEPVIGGGANIGPDSMNQLLQRSGRGWTLVVTAADVGVLSPWDREWRTAPDGLAALVRSVVDVSGERRPGGVSRRIPMNGPVGGDAWDEPMRVTGFRARQVGRGRGGGAPGEILTVSIEGPDRGVRVRSTRRPGQLVIASPIHQNRRGIADEVFLPWWSLADVLSADTGTSMGEGR